MSDQNNNLILDEFTGLGESDLRPLELSDKQREMLNKNGSLRLPDGSLIVSTVFRGEKWITKE